MPAIPDAYALALLAAALLLFLISTRQGGLWMRALIWLAGVAALGAAAWAVLLDPNHYGLIQATREAAARGEDSALAQALRGNLHVVAPAIVPMFDLFWILGAVVAVFSLIAFTPGEALEHAVRPFTAGVLGAIAGGLLALSIIAIGFGGAQKRGVYLAPGEDVEVIDGDTLRMGAITLRLYGIDAPERDQSCLLPDGAVEQCGAVAHRAITEMLKDSIVVCGPPPSREEILPDETFGRPIVVCSVRREGVRDADVGEYLTAHGWAGPYINRRGQVRTSYGEQLADAERRRWGVWRTCSLQPNEWRSAASQLAFEQQRPLPQTAALGDCSWHPSFSARSLQTP